MPSSITFSDGHIQPFLRWAGGKSWLKSHLSFSDFKCNNYFEPFLGSASFFCSFMSSIHCKGAFNLSDTNANLINAYECVISHTDEILKALSNFAYNKDEFYYIRNVHPTNKVEQAIKFIYLNKTCFNGLYRVNRKGYFNVPYGNRSVNLLEISKSFASWKDNAKRLSFSTKDFSQILSLIKKNDLIFLDPPYASAHSSNSFVRYNESLFSWEDQIRLNAFVSDCVTRGAYFILTNLHHKQVINLYKQHADIYVIKRKSLIGVKTSRVITSEILVTNIPDNQLAVY